MRSYPSCWNSTLTKLGFRRKLRKKSRRSDFMNRRSLFETLETRQMLSASTGTDTESEAEAVVVGGEVSTAPIVFAAPAFVITGGESSHLFDVLTSFSDRGRPIAEVSLKAGASPTVREWHDLELTLRQDDLDLARYQVTVMLAGDEIVQDYRDYRLAEAELRGGTELSSGGLTEEFDRVLRIGKEITRQERVLSTASEKIQLYADVLSASDHIERADSSISQERRVAERTELGHSAVLLVDQIKADLQSEDLDVRAAAQSARDRLVESAGFEMLAMQGFGVNTEVKRSQSGATDVIQYSAIYEAGQIAMGDYVLVDLGESGLIEVIETPLSRWGGFGWAAATGTASGVVNSSIYGDQVDHSVVSVGPLPDPLGDAPSLEVSDISGVQTDGLFRFDISQYTQYVTNATVTIHPMPGSSPDAAQEARVLPDEFNEADDLWSEWSEDTEWGEVLDRDQGFSINTTDGASTWTVGLLDPIVLDVANEVRRKLRAGDLNFDTQRGGGDYTDDPSKVALSEIVIEDILAFELLLSDSETQSVTSENEADAFFTAFEFASFDEILERADINRDNIVEANDLTEFLAYHGVLIGDIRGDAAETYSFSGTVDAVDIGVVYSNWTGGAFGNFTYLDGDLDFDNAIHAPDAGIIFGHWSDPNPTLPTAAVETLTIRVNSNMDNSEGIVPDPGGTPVYYATADNPSSGLWPKLDVEEALVVNSLEDLRDMDPNDGVVDTSVDPGFQITLRAALEEINDRFDPNDPQDYVIRFAPELSGGIIDLTNGELLIAANVNIEGLGAGLLTVDAGGASHRIFNISHGTSQLDVSISDLTLTGGNVTGHGGGIYNNEENLVLNSVTLADNTASVNGGGIFNNNGTLLVTGNSISANEATTGYGGGIYSTGDLTLTNVIVGGSTEGDGNTAGISGGGILSSATTIISGGSIASNKALGGYGGGIYNAGNAGVGSLSLTDVHIGGPTSVEGNTAFISGGGIYNVQGAVDITGGSIANNEATTGTGGGGGIFSTAGTVDIHGGSISSNESVAGYGGGIHTVNGTLTLDDVGGGGTLVAGNSAFTGGGIYNMGSDLTLTDAVIEQNTAAEGAGGGIYSSGNSTGGETAVVITNSEISDNVARNAGGLSVSLQQALDSLVITNSSVDRNSAKHASNTTAGGGIYVTGYTMEGAHGKVEISGTTIAYNSSYDTEGGPDVTNRDGGVYISYVPDVDIINSTISNNSDEDNSGGLRLNASSAVLRNVTIAFNQSSDATGGGLKVETSSDVVVYNTIVAENTGAGGTPSDVVGSFDTASLNNLIGSGADPGGPSNILVAVGESAGISPLSDNGGVLLPSGRHIQSHAILGSSLAVDAGDDNLALDPLGAPLQYDQRGFARKTDQPSVEGVNTVDIGAYELQVYKSSGDFNGDGRSDQIFVDPVTGNVNVELHLGNRYETNTWGVLVDTGSWNNFQTGDFNGDGRDDILAYDTMASSWTILLSDGSLFNISDLGVPSSWTETYAGDFDDDGSDELVGRVNINSAWEMLQFNESTGAAVETGWGSSLTGGSYSAIYAADANRDGRDDLIGKSGGAWLISLSQSPASFGAPTNWFQWSNSYVTNPDGLPDVDAPIQQVIDIFSDIYNTIELELYPGLMKGIDATAETKAGNPWDQAALLVDRLELAGFEADIATGIVDG